MTAIRTFAAIVLTGASLLAQAPDDPLYLDLSDPKWGLNINSQGNEQGKPPSTRADLRFGEGPNGEIFILNKRDGVIRRIVP